jgi:tyrosinase
LDWFDLANSSIWDGETGFGGDGDGDTPITVGNGRCVTTGPFTDLRPVRYNHTYTTHCLSRGFRDGNQTGRLPATPFSPEIVGALLRENTYTDFVQQVEYSVHNIMHLSIAGDFLALTAANGIPFPLFVECLEMDSLLTSLYRSHFFRTSCPVGPTMVAMAATRSSSSTLGVSREAHVQLYW